jgi:peptidoglycan hydrolase-like protein with peptidoglycan-binding domain
MKKILTILILLLFTNNLSAFDYEKLGSKNDHVYELQEFLITNKYLKIKKPTGYFGKLTQTAVKKYQKAKKIKETGVMDWETLNEYKRDFFNL